MANREDLLIIRAARAGQASAQLTLGKRYLFGGSSLPKSLTTALYWLDRAAQQDEVDAWLLIGRHVPFETVRQVMQPAKLCIWYERAFDAGVVEAGVVLARLVVGQPSGAVSETLRSKALRALQAAAHAGIADAQWLLAQAIGQRQRETAETWTPDASTMDASDSEAMVEWATRAARSGVTDAQYALAEHAWVRGDHAEFLRWALPLMRRVLGLRTTSGAVTSPRDVNLALRSAQGLIATGDVDARDVTTLLEFAAQAGDPDAQLSLGLWLAHMDESGKRIAFAPGLANYKRAIRWLSMAAGQGRPAAWYALSRIYLKPECSQRNPQEAQHCLDIAARTGHAEAQLALGIAAWRSRREKASNDVVALGWLQKAAAQGVAAAGQFLERIIEPSIPAPWAHAVLRHVPHDALRCHPLLVARLELAVLFRLSRAETLLIDPTSADHGHCLVVDIRAQRPHSKRRLISIQTTSERQALDRIVGIFNGVNCGPDGPEGNYRQRLYRLKTLTGIDLKL